MYNILVDVEALHRVLRALTGPSHYIRELQVRMELQGVENPINQLIEDYDAPFAAIRNKDKAKTEDVVKKEMERAEKEIDDVLEKYGLTLGMLYAEGGFITLSYDDGVNHKGKELDIDNIDS